MLSLKRHKEICCELGCCSLEFRNVPVCFPNSHLAQTNREQKEIYGAGWWLKEWEGWGALLKQHSWDSPAAPSPVPECTRQQCVTPWICHLYGAGEVWESHNQIFSLETILFPYRISCISLLSLPFTRILTYKPMFVLLSSFSLPTYFPSEIMRWTICRNNIFDKYTPFSFSQIIWEQTLIFYYFVHYLKYLSNCLQ